MSASVDKQFRHFFSPVTLHVNFCVTKQKALSARELWLYRSAVSEKRKVAASAEQCLTYDVRKIPSARWNWTEWLDTAHRELDTEMRSMLKENDLLMFPVGGLVYMVQGGALRPIPNKETFVANGFDFGSVRHMDSPLLLFAPRGAEVANVLQNMTKTGRSSAASPS